MFAYRSSAVFDTAISQLPMARRRGQQIRRTDTRLKSVGFTSPQIPTVPHFPYVMEGMATVVPCRQAILVSLVNTS
jgi:hypothetical protein